MDVVTGAFGYIGRHIAQHLLDRGEAVRTITTHTDKPNPFGTSVEAFPYAFDRPAALVESLRGARTLYNIAWLIRTFPVFSIFGSGAYRRQPVFVGDLATLALDAARGEAGRVVPRSGSGPAVCSAW